MRSTEEPPAAESYPKRNSTRNGLYPHSPCVGKYQMNPYFWYFGISFGVLVIIPPRQAHPRVCGVPDGKRRRRVAFDATVAALDMAAGSLPFPTAEAQHLECRI